MSISSQDATQYDPVKDQCVDGAPGKDEWTKVEKFGIPINILFIAFALFSGYRFNIWQEEPFDHSEINDTFLVHLSSPEDILNKMEKLSYFDEVKDYADETHPLNSQMLNAIREYIYVNLKKEFMNHRNVSIYYPENKTEIEVLAIGIGHDVSRYYDKAIKITDVNELGENIEVSKDVKGRAIGLTLAF